MEQEVKPEESAEVSTEEVAEGTEVKEDANAEVSEVATDEIQLPPPTKKKQSAQERIDEITRLRRDAEREAEFWRNKALGETTEEKVAEVRRDGRPTIEQFKTAEEYEDALIEWHDNKRQSENKAKEKEREEREALLKFNERAAKVRETYEDFDEIVERPVFTPVMRSVLLKSEAGPEVSYFLGRPENQTIANRIKSLQPEEQIYELGKLETKLILAKNTRKTTSAPPPIEPVGGVINSKTVDESKMTDDEWFAWRKKQRIEDMKKRGY